MSFFRKKIDQIYKEIINFLISGMKIIKIYNVLCFRIMAFHYTY